MTSPALKATALAFAPFIAQGLSRFAYGLILPEMRADLGWSFAQAGGVNTANALGYLFGAIATSQVARLGYTRKLFQWSLASSVGLLALTATTSSYLLISVVRLASGATSAAVFIAGASLAGAIRLNKRAGLGPTEVYFAGVGLGIAASSVLALPEVSSAGSWRFDWLVLAAFALLCVLPPWFAASSIKEDVRSSGRSSEKYFSFLFLAYGVFGLGYIGYMTFIASFFASIDLRAGQLLGWFWLSLGVSAVAAPILWKPLIAKAGYRLGLPIFCSLCALACAVPVLSPGVALSFISGILFGGTFLSAMGAVTVLVASETNPGRRTATLAVMTVWFAIGQVVGPLAPGFIADAAGLGSALAFSAGMLLLAGLLTMFGRRSEGSIASNATSANR